MMNSAWDILGLEEDRLADTHAPILVTNVTITLNLTWGTIIRQCSLNKDYTPYIESDHTKNTNV